MIKKHTSDQTCAWTDSKISEGFWLKVTQCLTAVCSQFQSPTAGEGGGRAGRGDSLLVSLHWWLPRTCRLLAHQRHRVAPWRVSEDPHHITPWLQPLQHHQPPDGQHFQGLPRVVHDREPVHEPELDLHQPWVTKLSKNSVKFYLHSPYSPITISLIGLDKVRHPLSLTFFESHVRDPSPRTK